jgi:LuxR family transcriptional regulator, positive regulator of biofilm formation
MTILIDLGNELMAEALSQRLVRAGYDHVVRSERVSTNGFIPDVLLVDSATLRHELLTRYPDAKVLLIDTGIEPENLPAMLLSYRIHGILSSTTEFHLFKKALKVVSEGQVWIDNGSVKALFHHPGTTQSSGISKPITGREREIIASIHQGLSNKEIAQRFGLSQHTVKAHLNRIYRKLGVRSRSKLMAQTMNGQPVASA